MEVIVEYINLEIESYIRLETKSCRILYCKLTVKYDPT